MSKKIIGILLVVCLIIGLLPMVAIAAEPKKAKIGILSWTDMEVTEGGAPKYLICYEYEGFTSTGEANGTGWAAKSTGADENNWNIKFEYPTGGIPTVTFKNAKLDMIGNSGKLYTKKTTTDAETGETVVSYSDPNSRSIILPKSINDIKLVLIGDNYVEANYGIIRGTVNDSQYFKNVYVVGENGGKLSGKGGSFSMLPGKGYNLTIENATLNFADTSGSSEAIPIRTTEGDLIIKNSTITANHSKQATISVTGNITIENSNITAAGSLTSTAGTGVLHATGDITVKGNSVLNLTGRNNPGMDAKGCITIEGGKTTVTSPYYGVMANGDDASIIILGGEIEITAQRAFNKAPTLGAGVDGYAGLSADDCDYYDETKYGKAYVQLMGAGAQTTTATTTATTQATTKATTAATTKATTAATTKATTATQSTTKATTTTATQGNNPATGDNGVAMFVALMAVAMFGIVATVSFGKKRA